jgi:pimeloyl-ACP methyl ester carboxylesterase
MHLDVPTVHARDPLTRDLPDSWRRHARDMELEELPGCGHFLAEERPEEIAGSILEFCA